MSVDSEMKGCERVPEWPGGLWGMACASVQGDSQGAYLVSVVDVCVIIGAMARRPRAVCADDHEVVVSVR